jgi:NTE family protein
MILLFFAVSLSALHAQSSKPKIGLVLSGGGAKGIAHIRVLQVLDSLGIVPDYIAGTSMGSIVGALYASGYTGNQIDSIARLIPWTSLFVNSVTFPEINIEEKDEFGRYVYELPMKGLKPQFPMGIVEGQQIEELLADLYFPVNHIRDFNKLPTPFLCVAADIVKGEPVILNSGSLAASVRASMSIPTILAPVRIGDRLLVDGGVFMNLPVSYCQNMGADFIIAVDVGGGLMKEEELTSAVSLLLQTTFLAGNMSYEMEKSRSDIFVDVVKHLKYSTMDFEYGDDMMKSGDIAVKEVMPQLVELAKQLSTFKQRRIKRVPRQFDRYKLEKIELTGISEDNQRLVLNKFDWKPGDKITREEAGNGVHRLLGTRLFDKITYTIEGDSVQSVLNITAKEKPANALKFAIHYDSERGAGLIFNFTKRNFLLPASRALATINLAENPKARFNYYYFVGKEMKWWHFTDVYGERVIQNTFIDGTAIPDVINRNVTVNSYLNRTIDRERYWGVGLGYQGYQLKPKVDPRSDPNAQALEIIKYNLNTFSFNVQFRRISLDKVFFPTKGSLLRAEGKINFVAPVYIEFWVTGDTVSQQVNVSGNIQPYARLNVQGMRNIPMGRKTTLQLIGQIGLTQEVSDQADKLSAYAIAAGDFLNVGGQIFRTRHNNFVFTGLREAEVAVPQVITMGTQLQWEMSKNIYLIPVVNMLVGGYDSEVYWKSFFDFKFTERTTEHAFYQLGYGITASYMSLIGPIQLSFSRDLQVDRSRFFFNIGFNL